jgi:hypothetical protein
MGAVGVVDGQLRGDLMVIRRIEPISAAKVQGVLGAVIGLLIGACFTLLALAFGGLAAASDEGAGAGIVGMLMGAGAIIILPIFYGIFGFIGGLIWAFLYNLAAKFTGGLEIEAS